MSMWLARDKQGWLKLFNQVPTLNPYWHCWESDDEIPLELDAKDIYPEVTFESSPVEVELMTMERLIKERENAFSAGYNAGVKDTTNKICI